MGQISPGGRLPPAPSGWAMAAIALAGVVTLMQALLGITVWSSAEEYARAARDGVSSADVVTAYDGVGILYLGFAGIAYVVTCLWLDRARTLALAVSRTQPTRGRVWVWLGWWVPVVNFWFPLQVVRDVRDGSDARRTSVLGAWWACWLVMLVGNRVGGQLIPANGVPDADLVALLPWVETVVTAACVMGLVLWTQLIRDISAAQRTLTAGVSRGAPPP